MGNFNHHKPKQVAYSSQFHLSILNESRTIGSISIGGFIIARNRNVKFESNLFEFCVYQYLFFANFFDNPYSIILISFVIKEKISS